MELFLRRFGVYIIFLILAICFFKNNGFFSNKKSEIIKSDGLGYYSYLPSLFIYGDSSQSFVGEKFPKYYKYTGLPEYMESINDKPVDKYFFGTSVLMYPFFMTAHLLSYHYRQPPDGYSIFYQYLIGFSAVFYVFLGIFFCERLLRLYGANSYQSFSICALLVFATNLFFYAVTEPTMSHAFSFSMISAFLYFSKSIFTTKNKLHIIPAFVFLGLLTLVRPFNAIVILALPFLSGGFKNLKESFLFLFRHYLLTIVGSALMCFIIFLQMWVWHKQTGLYIVYSYTYERFYFDKPHIFNVLLSYKKGFFIYTPLCFVSLLGLYYLFKKNRFETISFVVFFFILVYVMSCWHQWYYGASFGFRPMVEYYGLFAILLLCTFRLIKKRKAIYIFSALCIFLLYVNQVQAYQYKNFILHWELMSRYKYWKIFLKTDPKWKGYVWDNPEAVDIIGDVIDEFPTDFDKQSPNWYGSAVYDAGAKAHSGKMTGALDASIEYSNTLVLYGSKEIFKCKKPAVRIIGYLMDKNRFASDKLQCIISYDKKEGGTYYYRSRNVDNFVSRENGWKRFEIALRVETVKNESDVIKVYFWNPEKESFLLDDLMVEFVEQD